MDENVDFLDYVCQYTEAIKFFLAIDAMLLFITVGNALWVPLEPAPRAIAMINSILLLASGAVALAAYYGCRRRAANDNGS